MFSLATVQGNVERSTDQYSARQSWPTERDCPNTTAHMSQQQTTSNTRCIEFFQGPILFTSPHGIGVYRKSEYDDKQLVQHSREYHTQDICVKLARAMKPYLGFFGSFVIWNLQTAISMDPSNLDPNFLLPEQFELSPWHQGLKKFKQHFHAHNIPMLHLDIHGKKDRFADLHLDIGSKPLAVKWNHKHVQVQQLVQAFQTHFSALFVQQNAKMNNHGSKSFGVEINPALHGYRGEDTYTTLSHQSVLLGIPAVQLEIPLTMRKALVTSDTFLDQFANSVAQVYRESISIFGSKMCTLEQVVGMKEQICPENEQHRKVLDQLVGAEVMKESGTS